MVVLDDIIITQEEIEIVKKLVENHKYHNVRKGVLIFRNIYTGEITIENQKVSFEDNGGMMFKRDAENENIDEGVKAYARDTVDFYKEQFDEAYRVYE
ncbi:MAG: hypothetical protein ACTIH2_09410 [Anaerococcus sp.]